MGYKDGMNEIFIYVYLCRKNLYGWSKMQNAKWKKYVKIHEF